MRAEPWAASPKERARKRFFERIRAITAYLAFPDWQTLINAKPTPDIAAQISM